jgi:SAM-dependent MidA family methyltransferase
MNSPAIHIEDEIRRGGPVTFARFMELALSTPGCGYYERPRKIGRGGDFFTSVSVGPVFGELLAFQFAEWLEKMPTGPAGKWQVMEAGAHDGQLALDILRWWRERRPAILAGVEYVLIEPSPLRRSWQEEKLMAEFANVRWFADLREAASRPVCGIIFANELLDAMPAHRLFWNAASQRWREWRVGLSGDGLGWQAAEVTANLAPFLPVIAPELAGVLPDGFLTEICPSALDWWARAAGSLAQGKLLTFDYGFEGDGWLQPQRARGSLRAYRGHRVCGDLLAHPGGQDITADVNFSAVRAAGEQAGLGTECCARQSNYLTDIFRRAQAAGSGLAEWTPGRVKQFQTLTHPEHLGHRFRALLQCR